MRIYEIHYRNDEDNNIHEYYTIKSVAKKRQRRLKKLADTNDYEDDNNGVNMLYDLSSFEVDITKKGIMIMLNSRFNQD